MKDKILHYLSMKGDGYLPRLIAAIPEAAGDLAIYYPVKPGYNPNLLIGLNVNKEFVQALSELTAGENPTHEFVPLHISEVIFHGLPAYGGIPLAKGTKGKKNCWLPMRLEAIA